MQSGRCVIISTQSVICNVRVQCIYTVSPVVQGVLLPERNLEDVLLSVSRVYCWSSVLTRVYVLQNHVYN